MTNRHERRKQKKVQQVVFVDYGQVQERDPNYGSPVNCYVCGTAHKLSGIARIRDQRTITDVPLCGLCLDNPNSVDSRTSDSVIRKYLGAPDLAIEDCGDTTIEPGSRH
jgi:hypothetical protein